MLTFESVCWGVRRWIARIDRRGFIHSVLIVALMMAIIFLAHGGL